MLPGAEGVNKLNIKHFGALFFRQGQNGFGTVIHGVVFGTFSILVSLVRGQAPGGFRDVATASAVFPPAKKTGFG
jgi:hypothetical protein